MIKEQVKSLWKLCFDDSEAFIELYFRLRYNNEVNLAIQSGEEVIAALQMLPYPMTFCYHFIISTGCSFRQAIYFSKIVSGWYESLALRNPSIPKSSSLLM